jgi:hypothetical protein
MQSKAWILMKTTITSLFITLVCIFYTNAFAAGGLSFIQQGLPYTEIKTTLASKGWKPVKNKRINQSSLYAQDIFEQGMEEVMDCISMELDACVFRYSKDNQILEIKTITRQLTVESFKTSKR